MAKTTKDKNGVFVTEQQLSTLVNRGEFEMLQKEVTAIAGEVREMAQSVNRFVGSVDKQTEALMAVVTNRTPEGSIPLETHKTIVKSLLTAFSLVVIVSIGVAKVAPALPALIKAIGGN